MESHNCPHCGYMLIFIANPGRWYCSRCGQYRPEVPPPEHYKLTFQTEDPELKGIIPDRYDALFYLGMAMFFFGFLIFLFSENYIFYMLCGIGNGVSMYAVYLDFKDKKRSVSGLIGNILAILWIILAWFIFIFVGVGMNM
jgi:hypothetical protein